MELYYVDAGDKLFPVPVKVLNYREAGARVNVKSGGEENEENVRVRAFRCRCNTNLTHATWFATAFTNASHVRTC